MQIEADFPIETFSEANRRDKPRLCTTKKGKHYYQPGYLRKAKRTKTQRADAYYWCRYYFGLHKFDENAHITITLTRLAPTLLDSDNLASAFKAVRDGVAEYLGIDDGSSALDWKYAQEKLAKTRAMRIKIEIT